MGICRSAVVQSGPWGAGRTALVGLRRCMHVAVCSSTPDSIHALGSSRSTRSDKSISHIRVVTPLMLLIVFIPISTVTVHGVRFVLRGQAMAYLPIITKKVQRRYCSEDGNTDMMTEEHWLLI
jgi:hypothetical protein